jgi:dTDP-4-dehydrorhamnose reductase
MRIAVTGSQGQIVRSLLERAPERGVEVVTLARPQFDFADPATIPSAVESAAPDVIVNAAAYTGVDKAEAEELLAHRINGFGAGELAGAADRLGIPILHFSTDYVFDGALDRPYREEDAATPLSAYGRSKLAGEQAVRAAARRHIILRTSWVYSPFGVNFVKSMLLLGKTRDSIRVIADQTGQPTSALDIADGVLTICDNLRARPDDERLFGTFHLAAAAAATCWAEFAEAIFAEAARHGRNPVAVMPITADQYLSPARRPANSRLETRKLREVHGVVLPSWRDSLPKVIERLLDSDQG